MQFPYTDLLAALWPSVPAVDWVTTKAADDKRGLHLAFKCPTSDDISTLDPKWSPSQVAKDWGDFVRTHRLRLDRKVHLPFMDATVTIVVDPSNAPYLRFSHKEFNKANLNNTDIPYETRKLLLLLRTIVNSMYASCQPLIHDNTITTAIKGLVSKQYSTSEAYKTLGPAGMGIGASVDRLKDLFTVISKHTDPSAVMGSIMRTWAPFMSGPFVRNILTALDLISPEPEVLMIHALHAMLTGKHPVCRADICYFAEGVSLRRVKARINHCENLLRDTKLISVPPSLPEYTSESADRWYRSCMIPSSVGPITIHVPTKTEVQWITVRTRAPTKRIVFQTINDLANNQQVVAWIIETWLSIATSQDHLSLLCYAITHPPRMEQFLSVLTAALKKSSKYDQTAIAQVTKIY